MDQPGFDPGTSRLQSEHSTDWATDPLSEVPNIFYLMTILKNEWNLRHLYSGQLIMIYYN